MWPHLAACRAKGVQHASEGSIHSAEAAAKPAAAAKAPAKQQQKQQRAAQQKATMPRRAPMQQRSAAAPQQQQQPSGKRAALARQAELALWEAEPDLDALRGRLCAALETFPGRGPPTTACGWSALLGPLLHYFRSNANPPAPLNIPLMARCFRRKHGPCCAASC